MGIAGWSAEEVVNEDCQYNRLPDGGWEWPLWEWKGSILQESGCAYGKFFKRKAAFISREWWPDFCNFRRSVYPFPEEGSIEDTILDILRTEGSLITRELRHACGFTGPKMRSRFDAYVTRLEMTSSIRRTVMDEIMVGDGLCSQLPKHCLAKKLAILNVLHRNHTKESCNTSERFYPIFQNNH